MEEAPRREGWSLLHWEGDPTAHITGGCCKAAPCSSRAIAIATKAWQQPQEQQELQELRRQEYQLHREAQSVPRTGGGFNVKPRPKPGPPKPGEVKSVVPLYHSTKLSLLAITSAVPLHHSSMVGRYKKSNLIPTCRWIQTRCFTDLAWSGNSNSNVTYFSKLLIDMNNELGGVGRGEHQASSRHQNDDQNLNPCVSIITLEIWSCELQ